MLELFLFDWTKSDHDKFRGRIEPSLMFFDSIVPSEIKLALLILPFSKVIIFRKSVMSLLLIAVAPARFLTLASIINGFDAPIAA